MKKEVFDKFGHPNSSYKFKEDEIISVLDAQRSTHGSSESIGEIFENQIVKLLKSVLPYTLDVSARSYITNNNHVSDSQDIIITDARYPKLFSKEDGSRVIPIESVLAIIECKSRCNKKEVSNTYDKQVKLSKLFNDSAQIYKDDKLKNYIFYALNCETSTYMDTILKNIKNEQEEKKLNLSMNQIHHFFIEPKVQDKQRTYLKSISGLESRIGFRVWYEPNIEGTEYQPMLLATYSPLSDFVYTLMQDSLFLMEKKPADNHTVNRALMRHFRWGTVKTKERMEQFLSI